MRQLLGGLLEIPEELTLGRSTHLTAGRADFVTLAGRQPASSASSAQSLA